MAPESILPGFCEALVGAVQGETREFDLTIPEDFAVKELAGRKIHYSVTATGLKTKKLPELNDGFASTIVEGKSLAEVRELAKSELARQKKEQIESAKREQVMGFLVGKVECELPQNYVVGETRRILADIVQQEQSRGLTDEQIKEHEKELVEVAAQGARQKLKGTFILQRIAEAEKVTVSQAELRARMSTMAARYGMTPEKLARELEKRDATDRVAEEVLSGKVIAFLLANAEVTVAAGQG
jgi:trigger factor